MNKKRKNCEFKEEVRRKQHIGQVLRAIRELRHLSCPDIAREYRISYPVIYDYESGRSFPRFHNARELFTALKVDPEIFLKYSSDLESAPGELAELIIRDSEESSMPVSQEETIPCDQDPFDKMILEAVRQGLKNLTPEEKTIFFRNTVNFTTNKIKEAFYRK